MFQRNAVVQGLTEKVVGSEDEVLGLIRQGDKRRHTGCTNMNERSSRSHTIFRMVCMSACFRHWTVCTRRID